LRVKAGNRVEGIFAQAVAMDNRGLKNTIHCIGSNIYIVNFDFSMILRFSLRKNEVSFATPVSFNANEYDSPDFSFNEDGKIVFYTGNKEYNRKKICRTGATGPDAKAIAKAYHYLKKTADENEHVFYLSDSCVNLLEEGLSHTEISVEGFKLKIRQRNVYSGTIIEITSGSPGFVTVDKLPEELSPMAMKTKDFMSLFSISKSLAFVPCEDFMLVKEPKKGDFDGVLALCRYDMVIDMYKKGGEENGGGQEPEAGTGEQEVDRTVEKSKTPTSKNKRR
jgi:hypothetical protein